jgi:CBS domain-containing protein
LCITVATEDFKKNKELTMQLKLKDVYSTNLVVAEWDEPLEKAYLRMRQHKIRHLPVRSDQGQIIGIISDRDFQRAMKVDRMKYEAYDMDSLTFDSRDLVRDYMSWPAKFIQEDAALSLAAETMIRDKVSSLLIARGNEVTGIITHEDLLQVLLKVLNQPEAKRLDGVKAWLYNSPVGRIADMLATDGI